MIEEFESESFPILYQDEWLVAIHKPTRMAVHRDEFTPRRERTCVDIIRDQLNLDLNPIHRLDGGTSGVLLFSANAKITAAISAQFIGREVKKIYHAVTRGYVAAELSCDDGLRKADKFQEAKTVFYGLKHLELPWPNERFPQSRYSFVKILPETGRFHQIRRHANYLAHPLVGDTAHGDNIHNNLWREHRNCHRLLLHASSISFKHPVSGVEMTLECDLPEDFGRHLQEMPWLDFD